jgi:hypothetical protein
MSEWIAELLPRGRRMEAPPASERLTATRGDDKRTTICDGLRVDGQWEHH